MHLKQLESVGFKSFAERIKVEFVPGVTAVVGPNGSGKSNITDAIRWVLGEQSAKSIRGSKMEDIIFQGSDTRKPLNMAEVTLILDNGDKALPLDYDEVSVTRRVYRSGESEFYLNKQACRLKDIIDLFMDSGLGREAFSIISQGKVEEILSSKADERRTIFEEAAGVLKYKQRKKKAEYKLAETQENLNRVEDIIHEIEQQIDPLRKQRDTAKEYLRLKENLKKEEVSLLVTEIEELHGQWQRVLEDLKQDKESEGAMHTAIQSREAALEKEQQSLERMDNSIESLQSKLLSITQELEHSEGKKRVLQERMKHFEKNKETLEANKQQTEEQLNTTQSKWEKEKERLKSLQSEQKSTKEKINDIENRLQMTEESLSEQIEDLKSEYIEYLNEQAAKRNEQQSIETQLDQLSTKKGNTQKSYESLITKKNALNEDVSNLKQKVTSMESEYKEKEQQLKSLKENLTTKRNHFQTEQGKLYKGYQFIEKLKSQEEMLEDLKEDFQGFFHGVKAILKARDGKKLSGIHGAIIELIDVPKEYVTAIETVLGGASQHVVVNDNGSARDAISWLKKTNNGRATFLPLTSIKARFVTGDIVTRFRSHDGFVGVASDLVSSKGNYQTAVKHLMGHVLVAKTLKDANDIAKVIHHKHRIVTLEGDVVNPSGSMSGGAKKKVNQSLFTREKDLKAVKKKRKEFDQRMREFEHTVNTLQADINKIETDIQQLETSLEQQVQTLQTTQATYREREMKLQSLTDNVSLYTRDHQQFDEEHKTLNNRKKQLVTELEELNVQLASKNNQMKKLSDEETTFKEDQEKLQQTLHNYQITLAEQDERLRSQTDKTKTLKQELDDLNEHYAAYKNEWHELMHMHENEQAETEIDEQILHKKEKKENLTTNIQNMRQERHEKTQLMQDEEREVKEETKKYQAILQAIQEKEVTSNRLDVALENRLTQLEADYTLTFEKAHQTYDKVNDTKVAEREVQNIKRSIDHLGNVNIGAIDEYERINERYSFLSDQQTDLVEAKQTLFEVIREMDEEMQVRFETTFTQIKDEFKTVFKELFGGGKAELQLTDPNHLLETGVDIIAQPPGKKLQHLGLLSGGERALTAIALLFAILRVRPVPFCVLDEVEAALDEANVTRFSQYVKMYSRETQFIIITHRKGTMEEADVLYGVTMQESGVSRLVSVRLEETKELINT